MFYVYVIQNIDGEIYIGSTNDLRRRLAEHKSGHSYATSHNTNWTLVYYEAYRAESDAHTREHRLKQHGQAKTRLKERIGARLQEQT